MSKLSTIAAERHTGRPDLTEDPALTLQISRVSRQAAGSGTWVSGTWVGGTLAGHRFEALAFPDHAEVADYELGTSRLSKLWLRRLEDGKTVYHWDRGLDVPPAAAAVVDFLSAGLAEHTFGE